MMLHNLEQYKRLSAALSTIIKSRKLMKVKLSLKVMQAIAKKLPKPPNLFDLLCFKLGLMAELRQLLSLITLLY